MTQRSGREAPASLATLGVAALYAGLTLILTYPTAWNLSTAIVGYPGEDNVYSVWEGWWFKVALLDWHASPATVPVLYYPLGLFQTMLTATPLTELTQAPLVALFDPVVAYNVVFLFSYFLTALFTYLLCYELTGNRWASIAGGFVFAFSPFRTIHAAAGHFTQIMTYWFPLYALFMLRVIRRPTGRDAVLAGIFMACSSLVSLMHTAYFVIPFTLATLIYGYLRDRREFLSPARLRYVLLALGTGAVILVPFYAPFLLQRLGGEWGFLDRAGTAEYAADLLAFLTPSPYHPLFSRLPIQPFLEQVMSGYPFENLVYVGWIPLFLAWCGRRGATARMWIGLAVATALLALGPFLKVGGAPVQYTLEDTPAYLLMPYALVKSLPLFDMGRTPARLVEPLMLSMAVMAALGLTRLRQRSKRPYARSLVVGLVLVGVFFEYLTLWPLPVTAAPRPTFYEEIARDGQDYAILDVPTLNRQVLGASMYYQTVHQHPIVGGYLWRFPQDGLYLMGFMDALAAAQPGPDIIVQEGAVTPAEVIARYGVRYVTLHKGVLDAAPMEEGYRLRFSGTWGAPVYEDDRLAVYGVPPPDGSIEETSFAALGLEWYTLEDWDGVPTRWMGAQGTLFLLRSAEGNYRLHFNAYPFLRTRQVVILVNGQQGDDVTVGAWQEVVTAPLPLKKGINEVDFTVSEGCDKPSATIEQPDSRCISIAVQKMELLPAETTP